MLGERQKTVGLGRGRGSSWNGDGHDRITDSRAQRGPVAPCPPVPFTQAEPEPVEEAPQTGRPRRALVYLTTLTALAGLAAFFAAGSWRSDGRAGIDWPLPGSVDVAHVTVSPTPDRLDIPTTHRSVGPRSGDKTGDKHQRGKKGNDDGSSSSTGGGSSSSEDPDSGGDGGDRPDSSSSSE